MRPLSRHPAVGRVARMVTVSAVAAAASSNPLLSDWGRTNKYALPPFADVQPAHFKPAFDKAMKHHFDELSTIVDRDQEPMFENVIAEFDRCGGLLSRTSMLFDNLCSSCAPPELQAVQLDIAPVLAAHDNKIYTFPGLFPKIAAVHARRDEICASVEQRRLTERVYLDFLRAGAELDADAQARYAQITERLSVLMTQFMQNVMADESEVSLQVSEADLEGCPPFLVAAARAAATERGMAEGTHAITLSRSLAEPFLTSTPRRDLREKLWRLWTSRGELDAGRDNSAIAKEILQLRVEAAALHGHETYAHYQTADTMAQTPEAVMGLLLQTCVEVPDLDRQTPLGCGLGLVLSQVESTPWVLAAPSRPPAAIVPSGPLRIDACARSWAPACEAALAERAELRAHLADELGEADVEVPPRGWAEPLCQPYPHLCPHNPSPDPTPNPWPFPRCSRGTGGTARRRCGRPSSPSTRTR